MIIELLGVSVPEVKKQEYGRAFTSLVGPIQVQEGCLSCCVFQTWPNESQLQIEARWRSHEDLIRHLQSDVYKKLLLLVELGTGPPVIEFFTVVELRGLDLVEIARNSRH